MNPISITLKNITALVRRIYPVCKDEFRAIFKDKGVMLIFFGAGLLYPILYGFTYWNEVLRDIPVAVVDLSNTAESRKCIRMLDATPELSVCYHVETFEQATQVFAQGKVRSIIRIPAGFSKERVFGRPAVIQVYCNMASMLQYKGVYAAVSYVTLESGRKLQIQNLEKAGLSRHQAETSAEPFQFFSRALFNPAGGFASFLMPAVLILIIQQTLVLGVGMLAGTRNQKFIPTPVLPHIVGKALVYFIIYLIIAWYNLVLVPSFFGLPREATAFTLLIFLMPFLLAIVFFSVFLGAFFKQRESSLMLYLFTSLPLLFMSGFSWPSENIPLFWSIFAFLFPSTFGIQGYLKLNSMGAPFTAIRYEWIALWTQVLVYAIASVLVYSRRTRPENQESHLPASG